MDSNTLLLYNMIQSQRDYVLPRIENTKNRTHYGKLIVNFLHSICDCQNYHDANAIIRQRSWKILNPDQIKFWGLTFENNPTKYDRLAVKNTLDILNSINTRFIEGGTKSYDIW